LQSYKVLSVFCIETEKHYDHTTKIVMIKKSLLFSVFVTLVLLFPACETDFNVDADWKEIAIVYGLLNQEDSIHYLRINKAFLGGNALEIVKIEDSSSYKNDLEVVLEGWSNNEKMQTITFDTITIANKDSGVWYNPYMIIYKGVGQLNVNYEYKLFIKNTKSGKEITSSTKLIHDFSFVKPNAGSKANFNPGYSSVLSWKNGVNAMRYEPLIRFHYYEVPYGTTDTIPKYIEWYQTTQYAANTTGYGQVEISVSGDAFYTVVASKISSDFTGSRLAGKVDYVVSAAGEEYDTYLNVNEPSTSLVQDRPEYTNIQNGFGLLSSRYQKVRTIEMNPLTEQELMGMNLSFVKSPWVK